MTFILPIYFFLLCIYYYVFNIDTYIPETTLKDIGWITHLYSIFVFFLSFLICAVICLFIAQKIKTNHTALTILKYILIFYMFQIISATIMFLCYYLYDITGLSLFTLFSIPKQHAVYGSILFLVSVTIRQVIKKIRYR